MEWRRKFFSQKEFSSVKTAGIFTVVSEHNWLYICQYGYQNTVIWSTLLAAIIYQKIAENQNHKTLLVSYLLL